jgi:SAM-dependent methyltransferase
MFIGPIDASTAMTTNRSEHWETVYTTKAPERVSWYRPHLETSLELLQRAGLNCASRVIDIGAGASTLMDDLLLLGVHDLIAVDLSAASLEVAQERLADKANSVQWIVGDIATLQLRKGSVDLWHDRAAFHFLVDDTDVRAYVEQAVHTIADGGFAIIAGFAPDGPAQCSGLPVARRDPEDIARLFSECFSLIESRHETHTTPSGSAQSFAYALLKKQ